MPKRDPIHMSAQRERIVRATIGCIADKGVERTSITDICRKAGMSVGAIYVHFANKQEIVAAALSYGSMEAVDLPGDWPLPLRVFVFWLAFIIWKRQNAAAAS